MKPSVARTVLSQFCVARYSVKMMTRSLPHFLPGRKWSLSQRINSFAFESSCADARPAHSFICLSRASSSSDGSLNSRLAVSTASVVASSYSSSWA